MASNELDIADDIEASDYFNLAVLNNGVTLKVSEPLEPAEPPPRRNLFALSNLFGLAVAATNNGFAVFALSALRQAYTTAKQRTQAATEPLRTVDIGDGGLTFLKIGLADKVVIASGPALQGGVGVWRLKSLVDGTSTSPLHVFPPATNAALVDVLPNPSDRPELLALLYQDGQIVMINMDSKATIGTFGQGITAACWSVKGKQIVCGDQNGNLTQYTPEGEPKTITEAPTSLRGRGTKVLDIRWVENTVFFVTYCDAENPMDTSIFVSTRAKDGSVTYSGILDPLMVETMDRPEARFNAWLKNWTPFKHLLLVCNATSNTIGHVGLGPVGEGGDNIAWSAIKNDLYTTLPLDTYPLGLEVDLTDIDPPSADDNAGTNALPTLWSYASDGTLSAWRIVNLKGEPYPSIASPKDIVTEEDAGQQATAAATATPAVSTQAPAAAGSPFGTSASPTAFGATTFGTGTFSSPPSFGRPPSFGAPPSFAPAFGQPGLGTAAAFGKPAFGQPALAPAVAPAKGGFSGFSTQASGFASPSSTIATSPFASASASPSPTPAFVSSQPAAFGTSTFGQSSTPSGSASMATSPAPAAFGQSSPFGTSTSTTSPFGSTKPTSGGFGAFAPSSDAKTTPSGFGAFSSTTSGSTSGFGFGTPSTSTEATKNAFGISQPSAFTGLREESAVAATPAVKPPGLDENDAEDMEPKDTTPQTGGALDFGDEIASDDEKQNTPLSFGGLGFGGSKPAATPGAAPAVFGSFGKSPSSNPMGSTSTLAASPFAAKQEAPAASKPTFSFGGFGQGPSDKTTEESKKPEGNQESAPIKPAFSFAKPASTADAKSTAPAQSSSPFGGFGKPAASTDDKKSTEGGASSSPFGSFGKPASASQTSAFGQPATFGKPSAFGQPPAFGQAPAFGSKSTFGPSQEKPAFSFGTPASESKSTGGFSSFASSSESPSTSPFASPAANTAPPVNPAFGQPGLFKGFGQAATPSDQSAAKEGATQVAPLPASEAPSKKEGAPTASSDVDTANKAASNEAQEERQALQTSEESETASETIASIKQEELSDNAVENDQKEQEVAIEEEDQEEGEEELYEEEEEYDEEDEEAYDEGEDYGNEEEEDESVARESSEQYDEKTGTGDEAEDEIVVPSASPSPPRSDESASPPGSPSPAPTTSKTSEISSDSTPRTTFAPAKSAFSFAPAVSKDSAETSEPAATPSWSFGAQQASKETPKAASSPFSGFGQASFAKPDENAGKQTPKPAEGPKPAFEGFGQKAAPAFSLPTTKAADSPKPFGLGNLQKATPRTSSPLASMPSFAPPASPSQTQSTFDLSNLSSTTSSPNASPTKPPQNLPVSTTPQAKPPAQTFFSQANKESGTAHNDKKTQALPAATPKATPTPNVAAEAVLSTVPPKLTSALPKDRQTPHVSQDTLNVFITMQDPLDALKESAAACMAFFHSVQPARLPKDKLAHPVDVLDYDVQWGMGDLPRLREATRSLSKTLAEVSQQAKDEEKAARSLEGSLLKTKAKSEEINRYLKAREDPQVAKMVRVRQLGPEQLENQNRIRRQTQNVNEALDELERTILGLKEKVLEEKLGRSPMQAPSLDSIYRAIRNLTAGLQSKIIELDDIGLRLDMAALTTDSPKKQADTTPKAQRLLKGASPAASENGSAARSAAERSFSHAPKRHVLHTTSRIERSVRRTLAAEEFGQKLKDAWLAQRKEPLLNTSANSGSN